MHPTKFRLARAGGILWDAFLIAVICAGAFWAWRTRDRWKSLLPRRGDRGRPVASKGIADSVLRLEGRSAAVQAQFRQLLSASGIGEKNIRKNFNEAKREGGASWLESTIEIARPPAFHSGSFLKSVLPFISRNGLTLMRDETEDGVWILEVGDRNHVFQRLVIRNR